MTNFTEGDTWIPVMFPCPSPAVCLIEVIVVIAVVSLSLIGNAGNLAVLLSTPSLRNSHGCLLISLAAADFLTGLVAAFSIHPAATLQSSQDSWPYSDTACVILAYTRQVGITNSGIGVMLLSVERYIAVAHPLRYTRVVTKKLTLGCIIVVWAVTSSVYSTIFVGIPGHFYASSVYACLPMMLDSALLPASLLLTVVAPALVILVTSWIVSKKLRPGSQTGADGISAVSRTNRKVKTFRMVQVMTASFILCYAPYFSLLFLSSTAQISPPQVVAFSVFWLLLANSFFNVIIYFTMNAAYQKRINELLNSLAAVLLLKSNNGEYSEGRSSRMNTVDSNRLDGDHTKASTASLKTNDSLV